LQKNGAFLKDSDRERCYGNRAHAIFVW